MGFFLQSSHLLFDFLHFSNFPKPLFLKRPFLLRSMDLPSPSWLKEKVSSLSLHPSDLSMVAELLKKQLLVVTLSFLSGIFVISRSCQASILAMLGPKRLQPSVFEGGLDDLESFQAWTEEIKTYLSQTNPALYEVLGQTAASKQPIDEDGLVKASQDVLRESHRALRVLQAKIARANMSEAEASGQEPINEDNPPEADQRTEYDFKLELDRNKLQVQNEGRQLGYLLVQKTKGETQLQVMRWIQSLNGWEAWRQLNLLHSTSKRSTHFKLLASLMSTSFETQPAAFLQQFNAWKEHVVRYQQLTGDILPDYLRLTAVVNGLKGSARHYVLLSLDNDSSFRDLDSLLQKYFNNTYVQSESSLNSVWDKAWRDKNQAKETTTKQQQPNNKTPKQQIHNNNKKQQKQPQQHPKRETTKNNHSNNNKTTLMTTTTTITTTQLQQ